MSLSKMNSVGLNSIIEKQLVVFDFDDTIVDCNSDTWVHQLAPTGAIPPKLEWKPGQDYFRHVQSILCYLHSQKVTEQDYYDCLKKMPVAPGVIENLIKVLGKYPDKYEIIILSDANSYFIDAFLKAKSIDNLVAAVLTNKGTFNSDGLLEVTEYHDQLVCPLSPRNLCKATALHDYITRKLVHKKVVYPCINYIGDGENDLCPSSKLTARDRVFPREGYPLAVICDKLKKHIDLGYQLDADTPAPKIEATIVPWTCGQDICNVIVGKHTS